ncbi:MAG: DUF1173 family protein [Pseudomonas balearica]|uniref:DUF1173 family protein n=1 Tax=Stutzerimonas balearica TaxID=74829 RepID=UPI0019BA9642|nr:DUF1173 family protein [Stutzerimonas balearica]MBC7198210.1 DUF1173 family protein [Stutzerimonas balearica]
MRIIDRSLQTLRQLSVVEEEALRLFASGKSEPPELLARIRAKHNWLACDCSYPAPVMHVAQKDGARLVLKNNPDAADHAPGCLFTRSDNAGKNGSSKSSQPVVRVTVDGHIALHSEFQRVRKGDGQEISRSNAVATPRPRALLSLLMSLMEVAGLDTFSPAAPRSLAEQFAAFRAAASRFVLKPAIPLDHVLDTRITKQRLVSMAKKLRETDAFGSARRYGVLVDVLQQTGPRQLVLDDGSKMDFFGNAESLHGRSVPMMAIATVASQEPGSNFYHLGKVAFLPLLSTRHLFPVVDDKDREHVHDLFGLLRWMHDKRGVEVTASRNLFQAGAGYVLTLKSGAQLVELDLNPSLLDGPMSGTLSLNECGTIDVLKKRVMASFLKGVPRD